MNNYSTQDSQSHPCDHLWGGLHASDDCIDCRYSLTVHRPWHDSLVELRRSVVGISIRLNNKSKVSTSLILYLPTSVTSSGSTLPVCVDSLRLTGGPKGPGGKPVPKVLSPKLEYRYFSETLNTSLDRYLSYRRRTRSLHSRGRNLHKVVFGLPVESPYDPSPNPP